VGYPPSREAQPAAVLGPRGHLQLHRAIDRGHLDMVAQRRLAEVDAKVVVDVATLPAQKRVGPHAHGHVEVAVPASPAAALPFSGQADLVAIVDAGGDLDLEPLGRLHPPGTAAGRARVLDNLPLTAAARTGHHVHDLAEDGLRHPPDLALATAVGAALRGGAGFGAAARAGGTDLRAWHLDLLFGAEDGLFKVKLQHEAQVAAASRAPSLARTTLAPKEHVEEIPEAGACKGIS